MKFLPPTEVVQTLPETHRTVLVHTANQPVETLAQQLPILGRTVSLDQVTVEQDSTQLQPVWVVAQKVRRERHWQVRAAAHTRPEVLGRALLHTAMATNRNIVVVPHPSYPEPGLGDLASVDDRRLAVNVYDGALRARDAASQMGYPLWLLITEGLGESFAVVSPLVASTASLQFANSSPRSDGIL